MHISSIYGASHKTARLRGHPGDKPFLIDINIFHGPYLAHQTSILSPFAAANLYISEAAGMTQGRQEIKSDADAPCSLQC